MRESREPRTAIQAAAGAIPRAKPSTRCDQRVTRLVYEYSRITASATGERYRVARLSLAAPRTKSVQAATTNKAANRCESAPLGMARMAVRGLAASIRASAMRLKAMAAERAETM